MCIHGAIFRFHPLSLGRQQLKVFLVGGAPGVGKITLGTALTNHLGCASVSIDDLQTVAQALTKPATHPGLFVTRKIPYLEYFTNSSVDQLKVDADIRHATAWPRVEPVMRKHATWGTSIVIDGWHLRPNRGSQLGLGGVWAGWIVAAPAVIETRERQNRGWMQGSRDPERMLENVLARSLWFNEPVQTEANKPGRSLL